MYMKNTKDVFNVAVIFNEEDNTYVVEVDGQSIGVFTTEREAIGHAELITFIYDAGYQQKEKDYANLTEEDTHYPFELPDNITFNNNFAGSNQ